MMPKRNQLHSFTDEEHAFLEKLRRSRTAAQQHVGRSTILLRYAANERIVEIVAGVNWRPETVWKVVKRFNRYIVASLEAIPRSGHPMTYGEEARGLSSVDGKEVDWTRRAA